MRMMTVGQPFNKKRSIMLVTDSLYKKNDTRFRVSFFSWQRAVKRCVNTGKNSKKYTKSKLFKASKKVRIVLWNKRLHICFTHAKRNYTFRKMSVIIRHDIYLKGVF